MLKKKVISYYLHHSCCDDHLSAIVRRYFKLQIDISLALGWRPDDLLFFSNVPFDHCGVRNYRTESWLPDRRMLLLNKYVCLDHAQSLYPNHSILLSDHDAFQVQDLDWEIVNQFPIATPNVSESNFQDTFCVFRPDTHRWVRACIDAYHSGVPLLSRGFDRHRGSYSSELNQRLGFNQENGFDYERDVGVVLELCDFISPGSEHSLDAEPSEMKSFKDYVVPDCDVVHLHLDNKAHRQWGSTNMFLAPFLKKY